MQITISLGLEELGSLPLETRQKIQSALNLPVSTPTQVVQQPPVTVVPGPYSVPQQLPTGSFTTTAADGTVTTQAVPVTAQPAPPVQTKQPQIVGNTQLFRPDMGHPTQMNSAVDVTTGRPVPIAPPSDVPNIPQFSNTPVNVTPVVTQGPIVQQIVPDANKAVAQAAAIRAYNRPDGQGQAIVNAALAKSGVGSMPNLSDANAGTFYQALRELGGA